MHIRAKTPQLYLLTLTRFYRERVGIYPLVCGHVGGLGCVYQDVEHRRLVDDRQKRYGRDDLLENIADFRLDF